MSPRVKRIILTCTLVALAYIVYMFIYNLPTVVMASTLIGYIAVWSLLLRFIDFLASHTFKDKE